MPARLRVAEHQRGHARRRNVEDVEAVPAVLDQPERLDQRQRRAERRRPRARRGRRSPPAARALANASLTALGSLPSSFRSSPSHSTFIAEIDLGPDREHLAALARDLADARGDQRRFPADVRADQQHRVGALDAGDGRVERDRGQARALVGQARSAALRAGFDPCPSSSFFAAYMVSASSRSPAIAATLAPAFFSRLANSSSASAQLASRSLPFSRTHGRSSRLRTSASTWCRVLSLDPLLVHVLVDARQDAHHLALADVEADVRADRVHHVDRRAPGEAPTAGSRRSAASAAARRPGRRRRGCRPARCVTARSR